MWISKDRWTELNERVDAIERRTEHNRERIVAAEQGIVTQAADGQMNYCSWSERNTVPVREAIYHILNHLGLRFAREPETPAHFALLPKSAKPAKKK